MHQTIQQIYLGILTTVLFIQCAKTFQYPTVVRKNEISDRFFGIEVKDPYRWLEVPPWESELVSNFIREQNNFTYSYLSDCEHRKDIKNRLLELWGYKKYGRPEKRGRRYFFFAVEKGSEVLYMKENEKADPVELLHPNKNGRMAYPNYGVSTSGELIAFLETKQIAGVADRSKNVRVLRVSTNDLYPEVISGIKDPQIAWTHDEIGFFYVHHNNLEHSDAENEDLNGSHIYYHKLGNPQFKDVLVAEPKDFNEIPSVVSVRISDDGQFLMLKILSVPSSGTGQTISTLYMYNLQHSESSGINGKLPLTPVVIQKNSPSLKYVTNRGTKFYFRSSINAKNSKLIEMDLKSPGAKEWKEIVPEDPQYSLIAAKGVGKNKVMVGYTAEDKQPFAQLRSLSDGRILRSFPLEFGELFSFDSSSRDDEVVIRSQRIESLPKLYSFDTTDADNPLKELIPMDPITAYNQADFITTKAKFKNFQNEFVDMVITHKKNIKLDGSSYAILVEREFEMDFFYKIYFSYMKDYDAVVAFPRLENKNGFKDSALEDFIYAAEFLVNQGYTKPERLIARGSGNVGLFAAAAANRRPNLFGAIVTSEAAFDMIRFRNGNNATNSGKYTDIQRFKRTYEISPLHNIRGNEGVEYPAVLVPTSIQFPVPFAFKYVAELQHQCGRMSIQKKPFLLRVVPKPLPWETEDPIDYGKYNIEKETDILCFLQKTTGLSMLEPSRSAYQHIWTKL